MDERRYYSRVKTDNRVSCRIVQESDAVVPHSLPVTDISPAGLCFLSQQQMQQGAMLKLQLSLPFAYQPDPQLYNFAKVAHCQKDAAAQTFKVGCYYVRPDKGGQYGR